MRLDGKSSLKMKYRVIGNALCTRNEIMIRKKQSAYCLYVYIFHCFLMSLNSRGHLNQWEKAKFCVSVNRNV